MYTVHVFVCLSVLQGADTDLRCHWTDMNALHYAVFFDCHEVAEQLCEYNPGEQGVKLVYTCTCVTITLFFHLLYLLLLLPLPLLLRLLLLLLLLPLLFLLLLLVLALVVTVCSQFDGGNALHIAAANLCFQSAQVLIKHNVDGGLRDNKNRLPYECIPPGTSDT